MCKQNRIPAVCSVLAVIFINTPAVAQTPQEENEDPIDAVLVIGTQTSIEAAKTEVAVTPGAVNIIDMDGFRERNVSSLADVLRYTPGVWASSYSGSDAIFLSSRGSNLDATNYDLNGMKLLQDGLPVTTADGNNHNRVVDPLSASHAIVARGANALTYGASTLGGAIDFVSETGLDNPGMDISASGGSYGQRITRVTMAGPIKDDFDGLLTVEGKHRDGFRDHSEQDRLGVYANAGWTIADHVVTRFYGNWLDNDEQLPGFLTQSQMDADPSQASADAVSGNYQLNVETWRLANKTSLQFDSSRRLDFGFSIEEQTLFHPIVDRIMVDFDGPGPLPPVEVFSLLIDTDHRDFGAMLRYNQQMGRHDLLFGINYGDNSVEGGHYRNLGGTPNGLTTVVDNDASQVEAFVTDRWQVDDRWTLVMALQGVLAAREVRNTDVESGALSNPHDDYTGLNPRIGLIYALREDFSLYANVSRLFEAPTNFELQDNVLGGDATLDPMEGTVIELGSRGSDGIGTARSWSWDVSIYYAAIDNEILSVDDPAAPGTSLVTNINATVHAGIEAMLTASLAMGNAGNHYLEPLLSLTVNEFRFDSDVIYLNNRLPAAPDYSLRGEAIYRNGGGFYVGPTLEFVGERYADFVNSYRIDSYALLGLRGGWNGKQWSVYVDVENLLDETYVAMHAVRNDASPNDAILNPGAPLSAYVGLRWQFN